MRLTIPLHRASRELLRPALEALTRINQRILEEADESGHALPRLYDAGVRYQAEPTGREDWDTFLTLLRRGWGDCEDLAAARASELRHRRGEDARADTYVSRVRPDGSRTWHAIVVREDGTVEDPSLLLGMPARAEHLMHGQPFPGDVSGQGWSRPPFGARRAPRSRFATRRGPGPVLARILDRDRL